MQNDRKEMETRELSAATQSSSELHWQSMKQTFWRFPEKRTERERARWHEKQKKTAQSFSLSCAECIHVNRARLWYCKLQTTLWNMLNILSGFLSVYLSPAPYSFSPFGFYGSHGAPLFFTINHHFFPCECVLLQCRHFIQIHGWCKSYQAINQREKGVPARIFSSQTYSNVWMFALILIHSHFFSVTNLYRIYHSLSDWK